MVSNSNQNILMLCTSVMLVCILLICQPIVETCLKLDDTISLIELDLDVENELEESSLQEWEKVLNYRVIHQLVLIEDEENLNSANVFIKKHWENHSQDIFIHPPEYRS